jgi:carboxyl-terminal processing protease
MNRPKFYVYLPIFFSIVLLAGVFIGSTFLSSSKNFAVNNNSQTDFRKVSEILKYIQNEYVDTINTNNLIDNTIIAMLENLDPHSSYITADELQAMNEPLQGNFEGIGIEFNIVEDTVRVVNVIQGGPAESVGLKTGDRIVKVNDSIFAGIKITNKMVMQKLKGKGGTKVKLAVKRSDKNDLLNFTITRGTIPIYSVDVFYMVTADIGYIKISRFAATTYDEYMEAFEKLKAQGLKKLIIDLRDNGGGFLNTAVDIADEFLKEGQEIVYTQGKSRPRKDYIASKKGYFENGKLAILIDDGSASASEILAGAIQDNDRGVIVGRRSFGKGLVQEESDFSDGSAIRLTIARYYTPTGRCIQKPYTNGVKAYYEEEYSRYTNGELENADSIKIADSLKYKTPGGKIVYGGGGIMPDVFVPIDTTGRTHYLAEVSYAGLVNDFAFYYSDKENKKLKQYGSFSNFTKQFNVNDALLAEFENYAEKNGIKKNTAELNKSKKYLCLQLKALIARNIYGTPYYYQVSQTNDKVLLKAVELLK